MSGERTDRKPPRARHDAGRESAPLTDAGSAEDRPQTDAPEPAEGERPRTRAEEMGIPPLWAVSGGGTKARELKKQLGMAEEAVESAKKDARDSQERYLRLAAEMENVQRRHRQDRQEQMLYGNAELIKRILPVMDNFHRALEHAPEGVQDDPAITQWRDGLLMVMRQFDEILESMGVEAIESEGQFDPNLHQAVMAEASDQHQDGEIIAELQRGYRLRDRVLRPSMVKVANNS